MPNNEVLRNQNTQVIWNILSKKAPQKKPEFAHNFQTSSLRLFKNFF